MAVRFMPHAILSAAALLLAACDSVEERVEKHYESGVELLAEDAPEKATLEFRNALQLNENHAPSRFEIAQIYEAGGEVAAALANYKLVTELDPTHVQARVKVAQFALLGGNAEEADRWSAEALELDPQDIEAMATRAAALFRLERREEAVALAQAAAEQAPDNINANVVLVSATFADGDVDGALARLDAVLEAHPEDLAVNLLKLRLLDATGRQGALSEHLELLVERFPQQGQFKRALVQLAISRGEIDRAEAALRAMADTPDSEDDIAGVVALTRFLAARSGPEDGRTELARRRDAAEGARRTALTLALIDFDLASGERERAIASLRAEIDAEATDGAADQFRLRLAQLNAAGGDLAEAEPLVDAVLSRDAANVGALLIRGALQIESYQAAEAVATLRAAANVAPENTDVMLMLARAHERNGSPDLAGDRLAAAAQTSGFAPEIATTYARFLAGRQQLEAADVVLTEAQRRNPDNVQILLALADLRLRLEDWSGVEEITTRLAALDEGADAARQLEAVTLQRRGRLDDSIRLLEDVEGANADGASAATLRLVRAYVQNNEVDKAVELVSRRLEETPDDVQLLLMRADLALAQNDLAAATRLVDAAVAAEPENAVGHVAAVRLRVATGDAEGALTAARAGIEAAANPAPVRLIYAGLLEQRQDFDDAIAVYETLYGADPNNVVVANNLAALLAEHRGDDADALDRASAIAQRLRGSTVPEFLDTYGWVQYLRGEYQDALRNLAVAAEQRPDNPYIRYHAGMAFAAVEQPELARENLQAALDLGGAFSKADEARAALDALPSVVQ